MKRTSRKLAARPGSNSRTVGHTPPPARNRVAAANRTHSAHRTGTQPSSTPPATFTSVLERSDNKLWGAHVCVPSAVARRFAAANSRRVVCTLGDAPPFQCAVVSYRKGVPVITVNTSLRRRLRLEFGDAVSVTLAGDESQYGLPLPDELREVLRQDAPADRLFHALTPGRQRTLLYIVGKPKSPDIRVAYGLVIAEHLKRRHGVIDYKALSRELRVARTRW